MSAEEHDRAVFPGWDTLVESAGAHTPVHRHAPDDRGDSTEDVRERAARVLQHQLSVAEQIVENILHSQRQRDAASRMTFGPGRRGPAYVDDAL